METWSWRSETEGRLRKAEVSLEAARALIERKPPCIDDAVNRASAAALQAARALVDARWPPRAEERRQPDDPTWRPGMPRAPVIGPYTKASWPDIVKQFEKAAHEMALPSDATEYLKALVEDGHIADIGDTATYESDEASYAVETAEKLVRSVSHSLQLAFALGYRELEDARSHVPHDEEANATTSEMMPVMPSPHIQSQAQSQASAAAAAASSSNSSTEPNLPKVPFVLPDKPGPALAPGDPAPNGGPPAAAGEAKTEPPPPAAPARPADEAKPAEPPAGGPTSG